MIEIQITGVLEEKIKQLAIELDTEPKNVLICGVILLEKGVTYPELMQHLRGIGSGTKSKKQQ